ncbi:multidrug effflux MFS transporter [Desulfococcaceae bacterium HSG8]|nr:multidrug effflux MFS transporter [Desulfococcaceae bacterium HSG8]
MKKIIALLALLAAFPPVSTDMYLPALPLLQEVWQEPLVMVNMTLVAFFITYCLFLLIYGPISDRFGRRRPLMTGICIYILASLVCALAYDVDVMIIARIIQGAGAAAASALSLVICKDLFDARRRERIIAYVTVIVTLSPMMAPIIGGWVVTFFSWRWIFVIQAGFGTVALIGVYQMQESLRTFSKVSPWKIMGSYIRLMGNRRFLSLTLFMSILGLPFFAFIAGSSDIYISRFGLSEQTFGYFFAFNAVALMTGALIFSKLVCRVASARLMTAGFIGVIVAGMWMKITHHSSPWNLALPMWLMSFSFGLCRPPTNNLILEQVDQDTGSASSLIIFSYFTVGAAAMWIISLDWPDKITTIGLMALAAGGLTLFFWLFTKQIFVPATGKCEVGELL